MRGCQAGAPASTAARATVDGAWGDGSVCLHAARLPFPFPYTSSALVHALARIHTLPRLSVALNCPVRFAALDRPPLRSQTPSHQKPVPVVGQTDP